MKKERGIIMENYFEVEKVEYVSKQTGQLKTMFKISYIIQGIKMEMTFKGDLHTLSIINQLMNDNCVGQYGVL